MRITQGTFSFLPDLTDEQISKQVAVRARQGWALGVELTDDPHPRNTYWEMWGTPMFDLHDAAGVMQEVHGCAGWRIPSGTSGSMRSTRSSRIRDGAPVVHRSAARREKASLSRLVRTRSAPAGNVRARSGVRAWSTFGHCRAETRHRARCWTSSIAELVGLAPVKRRIREIASFLLVARARASGLHVLRRRRCTWRSPATPARARRRWPCAWRASFIGSATCAKGISSRSRATISSGSTSATPRRRPRRSLKRAMGGVLFIDEAYYLYRPENEKDYGQEAIEILLQVMENQRDDLTVIPRGLHRADAYVLPVEPGVSGRGSRITSSFRITATRSCSSSRRRWPLKRSTS